MPIAAQEVDLPRLLAAAKIGLVRLPEAVGGRISRICRRSAQLVSGWFVMLDDGSGFNLVPWKPIVEQRLGQALTATCAAAGSHGSSGASAGQTLVD